MRHTALLVIAALGSVLALAAAPATAQSVTNALKGFSGNSDDPVQVEADRLEVREKDEAAVFSGNVVLTQGESTLKTTKLTIIYDAAKDDGTETPAAAATAPLAAAGGGAGRKIKRLEAEGGVVIINKEQQASGDRGIFDMQKNLVTLYGNVVINQGTNVIKGDTLVVDLTTQKSQIMSNKGPGEKGGGRVFGTFTPSGAPKPGG